MKALHYDDSKDLYEGLITENDDGQQSQVAQVFPDFREEYGHKFAAAPDMYEALKALKEYVGVIYIDDDNPTIPTYTLDNEFFDLHRKALAKANGK